MEPAVRSMDRLGVEEDQGSGHETLLTSIKRRINLTEERKQQLNVLNPHSNDTMDIYKHYFS